MSLTIRTTGGTTPRDHYRDQWESHPFHPMTNKPKEESERALLFRLVIQGILWGYNVIHGGFSLGLPSERSLERRDNCFDEAV